MHSHNGSCSFFKFEHKLIPAVQFPGRRGCWVSALPSHLAGLDRAQLLSLTHQRGLLTCACSEKPVRALLLGCCLSWGVFWFRLVRECAHCGVRKPGPEPTRMQDLVLAGCELQQEAVEQPLPLHKHQERFSNWSLSSLCLYGGVFWVFQSKSREQNESVWSVGGEKGVWGLVVKVGTAPQVPAGSHALRVLPLACLTVLCLQNPHATFMEPQPVLGPRADFKNDGDWEQVRFILLPSRRTSQTSHTTCVLSAKLHFLPTVSLSANSEKALKLSEEWGFLHNTLAARAQSRLDFVWRVQLFRLASNVPTKDNIVNIMPATDRLVSRKTKLPPLVLCTTQAHLEPSSWREQAFCLELGRPSRADKRPASLKQQLGLCFSRGTLVLCLHDSVFFLGGAREGFKFVLTLCHHKTSFYPCCTALFKAESVITSKPQHHRGCCFHPVQRAVLGSRTAWWELRRLPAHHQDSTSFGKDTCSDLLRFPLEMVILNGRVLEATSTALEGLQIAQEGALQLLFKGLQPHLTCVDLEYVLPARA